MEALVYESSWLQGHHAPAPFPLDSLKILTGPYQDSFKTLKRPSGQEFVRKVDYMNLTKDHVFLFKGFARL